MNAMTCYDCVAKSLVGFLCGVQDVMTCYDYVARSLVGFLCGVHGCYDCVAKSLVGFLCSVHGYYDMLRLCNCVAKIEQFHCSLFFHIFHFCLFL